MIPKTSGIVAMLKRYGPAGFIRLLADVLLTRLCFAGARIIRRPYYIRGRSRISIGRNFTSGVGLRLDALGGSDSPVLQIGNDVEVNDYVHIGAMQSVKIGNHVLIASKVFISDHNHGSYKGDQQSSPDEIPSARRICAVPVEIEDNVWIGEGVAILPGVKIGRGAIIAANSVVTCQVPPETIFGGVPARLIKTFNRRTNRWERV